MESKPDTARAIASRENGKLGGRPRLRDKYAPVVEATEQHLVAILQEDVPSALRDLVRGTFIEERTKDGDRRVYQNPPDLKAIELVMNRVMGRVESEDPKAEANASVVNIIRIGAPELGI